MFKKTLYFLFFCGMNCWLLEEMESLLRGKSLIKHSLIPWGTVANLSYHGPFENNNFRIEVLKWLSLKRKF